MLFYKLNSKHITLLNKLMLLNKSNKFKNKILVVKLNNLNKLNKFNKQKYNKYNLIHMKYLLILIIINKFNYKILKKYIMFKLIMIIKFKFMVNYKTIMLINLYYKHLNYINMFNVNKMKIVNNCFQY